MKNNTIAYNAKISNRITMLLRSMNYRYDISTNDENGDDNRKRINILNVSTIGVSMHKHK